MTPSVLAALLLQSMESVRIPKLPFGKEKGKGKGKEKSSRNTRPLKAVQGIKAWAKAQSVMLYGVEHDEIWVHEGFNEASSVCFLQAASEMAIHVIGLLHCMFLCERHTCSAAATCFGGVKKLEE